jgi:hypothetical protein
MYNRPPAPEILTAEDPLSAYESAIPTLLDALQHECSSSCLIREIVWSVYNNHAVGLSKICCLDQTNKDAVLAVINLRMSLGGDSIRYIRDLLKTSGEFARMREAEDQAKKLGVRHVFYPLSTRNDPREYNDMASAAHALNQAERSNEQFT